MFRENVLDYFKASYKNIHASTENVTSAVENRELSLVSSTEKSKIKAKGSILYYTI